MVLPCLGPFQGYACLRVAFPFDQTSHLRKWMVLVRRAYRSYHLWDWMPLKSESRLNSSLNPIFCRGEEESTAIGVTLSPLPRQKGPFVPGGGRE
ncbi:uncharacterized [Tachysurus ichikawai]